MKEDERFEWKKMTPEAWMNGLPLHNHHFDEVVVFIFLRRETQWSAAFGTETDVQRKANGSKT